MLSTRNSSWMSRKRHDPIQNPTKLFRGCWQSDSTRSGKSPEQPTQHCRRLNLRSDIAWHRDSPWKPQQSGRGSVGGEQTNRSIDRRPRNRPPTQPAAHRHRSKGNLTKKGVFSTNGDKTECQHGKISLDTETFTKVKPKWITDLNVQHKAIKALEDIT